MIFGHGDGYLTSRKSHSPRRAQPPLFVVNEACKTESDEAAATFHTTIVAKTLYDVTKNARPVTSLVANCIPDRKQS